MEQLSKAIETHYNQTRPDKKSQLAQETIFNYVKKCSSILQKSESNAMDRGRVLHHIPAKFIESTTWSVFIFGSQSDGTSSPSSDIDIAIHLNFKNTRGDKERLLFKLSKIISKNDPHKSLLVKCILRARYPIIKMYDIKSHDHMNVSIADHYCHARTELIKSYIAHHTSIWKKVLKSDECIRKLIVFVKHWSKTRGINGAYSGYINSFGYVVLVIKFIQWFEVNKLKKKHKHWNLGEILYEFYAFYISKFDWNRHCVSINQRFSFDDDFKEQIFDYKLDPYCDMQVIDPVNVHNNIAMSVGRDQAQHIKYEFIRSVSLIEHNKEGLFDMICDKESERESVEGCSVKYDLYGVPDLYYESLDGSQNGAKDARYDRNAKWGLTPVIRVMTQSKSSFSM